MWIKVGEHVRTDKGYIIEEIDENWMKVLGMNKTVFGRVKKHNKNFIKMIEPGDYVNGDYVYEVLDDIRVHTITGQVLYEKDIKEVVTKEKFKEATYERGGK